MFENVTMDEQSEQDISTGPASGAALFTISEDIYTSFIESTAPTQSWRLLEDGKCVNVPNASMNARGKLLLEFIFHFMLFAKSEQYSYAQASRGLAVVNNVMKYTCFDTADAPSTQAGCAEFVKTEFWNLLDDANPLFSTDAVKQFLQYITKSIIQNFALYYYAMHEEPGSEICESREIPVQLPQKPMDLCQGEEIIQGPIDSESASPLPE